MLYQIVSENGQKVKKSITGNGYGLPLGSIIAVYSNLVPDGYLPCNGATFDTTTYAALYAYLGSNRLPDLRECGLVGAGQSSNDYDASTNPNGIHAHDVYDVGEFKDDQFQGHEHGVKNIPSNRLIRPYDYSVGSAGNNRGAFDSQSAFANFAIIEDNNNNGTPRIGTTTHGKQVGVNYCIKATPAYVEPDTVSDMMAVVNRNNTYSTEETPTGKTWIDGKPIYRIVYNGSYSQGTTFATNVNELVCVSGYIATATEKTAFPFDSTNLYASITVNSAHNIVAYTNASYQDSCIVLEYTKTTD